MDILNLGHERDGVGMGCWAVGVREMMCSYTSQKVCSCAPDSWRSSDSDMATPIFCNVNEHRFKLYFPPSTPVFICSVWSFTLYMYH